MNMVTLKKKRLVLALSITAIVLVSTGLYYLATPAQGYTDKVKIIIPAEFRSRFPKLAGSVMIAMAGPEGFESYSIPLKDLIGKSREFNFGKIVSSWAKTRGLQQVGHVKECRGLTHSTHGNNNILPTRRQRHRVHSYHILRAYQAPNETRVQRTGGCEKSPR